MRREAARDMLRARVGAILINGILGIRTWHLEVAVTPIITILLSDKPDFAGLGRCGLGMDLTISLARVVKFILGKFSPKLAKIACRSSSCYDSNADGLST